MKKSQEAWILEGYKLFANEGPQGLKVEVLAARIPRSKSSFYHHFADMEVFTEILLKHHLKRSAYIAERERACRNIDPELIELLTEVKTDLLFSRQLRVHRNKPYFAACFAKVNRQTGEAFVELWAQSLYIQDKKLLAETLLSFSLENFYLSITEERLNPEWLREYFRELQRMIKQLQNKP
jgi:AcrR family transcriptional regulator